VSSTKKGTDMYVLFFSIVTNSIIYMDNAVITDVTFTGEGHVGVLVKLSDGSGREIFRYYSDELSFTRSELVGLTVQQAKDLFRRKDIAYLRS
jgi:predicted Zn-dependent protease